MQVRRVDLERGEILGFRERKPSTKREREHEREREWLRKKRDRNEPGIKIRMKYSSQQESIRKMRVQKSFDGAFL